MMIRRSGALVALIAALSLAGCAGDTAATEGTSGAGAPAAPASGTPSAPVPSVEPTTGSPGGKGTPGGKGSPGGTESGTQTLTGTVAAGVEPGCLLLNGSSGSHLLIIKDDKVRTAAAVGSSVTVVGKAQPDMMTTCQQGTPFLVSSVRAG
jgi:hypothetical protein